MHLWVKIFQYNKHKSNHPPHIKIYAKIYYYEKELLFVRCMNKKLFEKSMLHSIR